MEDHVKVARNPTIRDGRRKKDGKPTEGAPVEGALIEGASAEGTEGAEGAEGAEGTEGAEVKVEGSKPVEIKPVETKPTEVVRHAKRNGRAIDPASLARLMRSIVLKGDLSGLSPDERGAYYLSVCDRLGMDPATKPFDFMVFQNKMTLYINRGGTDQLAFRYGVTREIVSGPAPVGDARNHVLLVTVRASMRMEDGSIRSHTDVAAVPLGDANAWMKVVTKAHRRSILGLIGLGLVDAPEGAEYVDARAETVETQRVLRGEEPALSGAVANALRGLPVGEASGASTPTTPAPRDQALALALTQALEGPTVRLPEDVADVWLAWKARILAAEATFPGLTTAAREAVLARLMDMIDTTTGQPWFSHLASGKAYLREQIVRREAANQEAVKASEKVHTDGAGAAS